MASDAASEAAAGETPAEKQRAEKEVVSVELPAPEGWTKKYIPKKTGTPKRNEIVFISPSGEEIKTKKQLDQYLRSHPGGPPSSEFDWGTGDTPRRSARISEKAKATETPKSEPPKKKERKSSSKKGSKNDTDNGESAAAEEQGAGAAEAKGITDVEMKETEVGIDKNKEIAPVNESKEENPETIVQDLADNTKNNVEEESMETAKQNADTGKNIKNDSAANGNEQKTENEVLGNDSKVQPPVSEQKKEQSAADAEFKDGETACEDGRQKNKEEEAPKSVPSRNRDDGQRQPEAAAVNC